MSNQYLETIEGMERDVYDRMVESLATGHWPDGRAVSAEQREHTMQAVIVWGEFHLPPEERIGFIDKGHKAGGSCDEISSSPLKWQLDGKKR